MSDIELVIKISESIYDCAKELGSLSVRQVIEVENAIKNGTPLPKGHGRLIDADALGEELHRYTEAPYLYALKVFNDASTIIEADKESEE